MARTTARLGAGIITCVLLPSAASAQQASASGIAGVVRDTSGAVLPGVTVEASSPAPHRKTRSIVTDSEGRTTSSICGRASIRYLHSLRLQRVPAGRHRAHVRVYRDGQRRYAGRRAYRNHHGDRRVAARRHKKRAQADGGLRRPAQRAAQQREEPQQPRRADTGIPWQRGIRRDRRAPVRSAPRSMAKAAPTSSSTAWASSTPPAIRATTPTPIPSRSW